MRAVIVVLFLVHLTAGFSRCGKTRYSYLDVSKYNNISTKSLKFLNVPRQDVTFRLWTRDQKLNFAPIYYGHLRDEPSIRPDKKFKVLIHGWTDCANSEWYKELKDEYLKKDDYNVIQVDWRKPAGAIYLLSAAYTKDVGRYVGELLLDLHQSLKIPLENIHLIGHSLGAHISGFAGKNVQKLKNKIIGRITALDPAGPLFLLASSSRRLSVGDALFVDVIHTDGGKFGYTNVLGHADFYPNGGFSPQPGCILFKDIVETTSCSHRRAFLLFGESINSKEFVAQECPSFKKYKNGECKKNTVAIMGDNAERVKGVFYLTTNSETPYAKNGAI